MYVRQVLILYATEMLLLPSWGMADVEQSMEQR